MSFSLLVISSSYSTREMLARYLSSDQFVVYTADSAQMALPLIEHLPLTAIVSELDLGQVSGLDLLLWLNHKYPHIHQMLLCDTDDSDLMQILKQQRAAVLQKNQLDLVHFRSLLQHMCESERGVTYQFSQISLFELVHLASHAEQAKHVYITSHQTAQEGLIYFHHGRVQHAIYDTFSGEEAFHEIMQLKRGLFQETEMGEMSYYSIDSGLDQLMALSALRMDQHNSLQLPIIHCTLLSPDMQLVHYFVDTYPEADMEIFFTEHPAEALEQVAERADLLIIDLDLPGLDADRLLDTLTQQHQALKIVLLGSQPIPQLSTYLRQSQVIRFFLKPGQFRELGDLVYHTFLSQQFSGSLLNLSLFSLLQTFVYFRQPRLLEITDFFSGQTGQIFLSEGDVQHASFGLKTGRDALKDMLSIRYGLFRQATYWEPVAQGMKVPFTRLLLYLSRFLERDAATGQLPRDLLLQNGEVITLQPEKVAYLLAMLQNPSVTTPS